MLLTEQEKQIYNFFLQACRKNKPYTKRKNFDNIDNEVYIIIKKLSLFFKNNPSVNKREYFSAPYSYYKDQTYFDIGFFITPRAVKCYTLLKQKQEKEDPDNEDTIKRCKECYIFIYNYCKENNLTVEQYAKIINGTTPLVLQHLREHKINFYVLHSLNCERNIFIYEEDLLDFFIKDFKRIYDETRINFLKSIRLKTVLRKSFEIINNKLLQKTNNQL